MHQYRIALLDEFQNEICLIVSTCENLVTINKNKRLDCWLDVHYPRLSWCKIVNICELQKYNKKNSIDIKVITNIKSDNSVAPRDTKFNNKYNN